jgi:mono/diheme cytochrome c family protein
MKKLRYIAIAVFALGFSTAAFADDPAAVDMYNKKCAACHGKDGKATAAGTKMGAKDFTDPEVAKMKEAELTEAIAKGKGKMPGYAKSLKEDEIKKLVAVVKDLQKPKK